MKTGLSIKGPNKCDKTLGSEQLLKYIYKKDREGCFHVSELSVTKYLWKSAYTEERISGCGAYA